MIAIINPEKDEKFYITKNFVINKDTTAESYYDAVKKQFQSFWDTGSGENTADYKYISVEVWGISNMKKISKSKIK